MTSFEIAGSLDPDLAWDGNRIIDRVDLRPGSDVPGTLRGSAAAVLTDPGVGHRIIRDPLGINKLFWVRKPDEGFMFAARPRRLIDRGYAFADVRSIPSGSVVDMDLDGAGVALTSIRPVEWLAPRSSVRDVHDVSIEIRHTLQRFLGSIAQAYPAAEVFVCLSGGLDSSGIAVIAKEVFPDAVAVSFDIERDGRASDDRIAAERLARDLHMPFLDVTESEGTLLERIDLVLVEAIDWRDFNVHAALVNAALADGIAAATARHDRPTIVFTGDLANEFLVDYHTEHYRGEPYYRLPRLDPVSLRAALVRGLDTSHRETGVFAVKGLTVVQPYSVAADSFLALPGEFLLIEDRKQRLAQMVFGRRLPEYIYRRPKVRAQLGGSASGGVLGACIDRGLDQAWFAKHFAELHDTTVEELGRFVRAGVYRTGVPTMGDDHGTG
jgi:asparagine synthetase B (glutamine-hydrolysing)